MRRMMAFGLVAAAAAMLAAAGDPPKPTKGDPDWVREPPGAQIRAHLSPEALKAGGRAIMRCHVQESGVLDGCAAIETPAGSGFGEALLSQTGGFQMSPLGMSKLPPNRQVLIPYDYFPFDTAPDWLRRPTQEELQVLWPTQAAKEGIGGRAVINCLVNIRGSAYDCVAVEEDPPGKGFGAAAIGLSQVFQFRPAKLHGEAVVSALNVPVVWQRMAGMAALGSGKTLVNPAIAWTESPTFADLAAAYPRKARDVRVTGRANLACDFARDGRVKNCRAVMEAPSGQGFGHAAESLAKFFLSPVTQLNGKPISEYAVQIPIVFDPSVLDVGQPAVGSPKWAALPSAAETQAAFAPVVLSGANGVRVILDCKVQMGGGVGDCAVEKGQGADQGVAQAAMTLAPHFKLTTWTVEGLPTVGGSVRIPLRYEPEKPTPPAAPPKP